MAVQSLGKICRVLMIIALLAVMFSTQIAHSNTIEACVKSCVPNQCMKVAKNGTPAKCEKLCKQLCLESPVDVDYIVPRKAGHIGKVCKFFGLICD